MTISGSLGVYGDTSQDVESIFSSLNVKDRNTLSEGNSYPILALSYGVFCCSPGCAFLDLHIASAAVSLNWVSVN